MDDAKLVEYVQSYPNLYDRRRSDFKDAEKSAQSWRQISQFLQYSVGDCTNRWKYLREKFCRVRRNLPSGSGAELGWEHFKKLLWLEPYLQKRKTKSNVKNINSYSENSERAGDLDETEMNFSPIYSYETNKSPVASSSRISVSPIMLEELGVESQRSLTPSADTVISLSSPPALIKKRKRQNEKENSAKSEELLAATLQTIGATMQDLVTQPKAEPDPLNEDILFGQCVSAFLKKTAEGTRKNNFKKTVFSLKMDYNGED